MRTSRTKLSLLFLTLLATVAFAATPAQAARGHIPTTEKIGAPCTASPCPAGELNEPAGVAVNEATGNVYVADKGDNRVEWFSPTGAFEGEVTAGPNATGEATLTEESNIVTAVMTLTGTPGFAVNEEISGEGIPAGTIITALEPAGPETLELSRAVETGKGTKTGVFLTAEEHLIAPEAIAVDNSCQLHKPVLTESTSPTCAEFDPSDGDVYVTVGSLESGAGTVDKFSSTGAYLDQLTDGSLCGVAVDAHGTVWLSIQSGATEFTDEALNVDIANVKANLTGYFNAPGFAVNSEDDLFFHGEHSPVFETGPEGCPSSQTCGGSPGFPPEPGLLNAEFDPEGSDWLAAELTTNDVYVDHGATLDRRAPDGSLLESLPLAGGAGAGVGVSSQEEQLYVAQGTADDVEVFGPVPPAPPALVSEEASDVTAESATLEAAIEPRSEPFEDPTSYWFEYVSEAQFARAGFTGAVRTPAASLAPTYDVDTVTPENVQGLAAGTTYRYRVFAENELGKTEGQQSGGAEVVHTFTTQAAGPFALPDDRQWEMVSPPNKHGANIFHLGVEVPIQASAVGGAFTFATNAPTESEPQGLAGLVQVLSTRTSTGWVSRDLSLPHETAVGPLAGTGSEYRLFSADLSHAVVQPLGAFVACTSSEGAPQPCLSPEASEQTAFLLDDTTGAYHPLVTPTNDTASPPEPYGKENNCIFFGTEVCGPQFVGATPDLAHVILESSVSLTSPASGGLYEFSAGKPPGEQLAPISILPGGGPAAGELGLGGNTRHAISEDGSRVFFGGAGDEITLTGGGPLYMRDLVKKETLRVAPKAYFQDASSNGSTVFYSEGGSLFECRIVEGAGPHRELECEGGHGQELASGVLGLIPGVSEDGSYLYFVSSAAKPSTTLQGSEGVEGSPNLYVRHAGVTSLIAVLSPEDKPDWDSGRADLPKFTARVSPNGQYLEFMSDRSLTGYDNLDSTSGQPDEEVYEYHAPSSLSTEAGALTCASCNPSGARPVGVYTGGEDDYAPVVTGKQAWEHRWLAANVPGWNPFESGLAAYQPRYLSDGGRLFFNARDPLVSKAVGGSWDVYQYEPENVPSGNYACTPSSTSGSDVYKPAHPFTAAPVAKGEQGLQGKEGAGCVALLSSGESGQESAFLDATESGGEGPHGEQLQEGGGEVFFMTTAKLSKADTDNTYDVYDAHECTTQSPCLPPAATPPPECATEASCKPSPEPQPGIYGPPASATFSGPGNESPEVAPPPKKITKKPAKCKSGFVRKTVKHKSKCVRAKRRPRKQRKGK
jgi:hypothetical protein